MKGTKEIKDEKDNTMNPTMVYPIYFYKHNWNPSDDGWSIIQHFWDRYESYWDNEEWSQAKKGNWIKVGIDGKSCRKTMIPGEITLSYSKVTAKKAQNQD